MKPEEIYLLFLEEVLELLPLIQAGLTELSQEYNHPETNTNKIQNVIADILPLLETLNMGASQFRDACSTQGGINPEVFNLGELENLIGSLQTLLASCAEETAKIGLLELNQLWQTYLKLKYSLLAHFNQVPSGKLGLLAKGEALFSLAQLKPYLAESTELDESLHTAIVEENIVHSLANLELTLANPNSWEQSAELKHQVDIFSNLGELLELEDLMAIAKSVATCLEDNLPATQLITQRALACWQAVQTALSRDINNDDQAEDWRNYLLLVADTQSSTATDFKSERPTERILQAEPFFMWLSGCNIFFLPANLIVAMVIPQPEQIQFLDNQHIFIWQSQNIRLYQLSELILYNYLLPDNLITHPSSLILVVQYHDHLIALEIGVEEPLVELSLTLKSFDPILTTPDYICGCTVLKGDRFLVVIDVAEILSRLLSQPSAAMINDR